MLKHTLTRIFLNTRDNYEVHNYCHKKSLEKKQHKNIHLPNSYSSTYFGRRRSSQGLLWIVLRRVVFQKREKTWIKLEYLMSWTLQYSAAVLNPWPTKIWGCRERGSVNVHLENKCTLPALARTGVHTGGLSCEVPHSLSHFFIFNPERVESRIFSSLANS